MVNALQLNPQIRRLRIAISDLSILKDIKYSIVNPNSKKSLPLLNEIVFKVQDRPLSINEVIQYTVGFQSIKYFSFYCKNDESDIKRPWCGKVSCS